MSKTIVSITRIKESSEEGIYSSVLRSINLIGGIKEVIKEGSKVLIIPNMSWNGDIKPKLTTDPRVTAAITKISLEAGAGEVVVGSASGFGVDTDEVYDSTGTRDLVEKLGVKLVDFKDEEYIQKKIPFGLKIKEINVAKRVTECDTLIFVPLIKIIPSYGISCALKGMATILRESDMISVLHKIGFYWAISDVLRSFKQDLTLVDGITPVAWPGMSDEGNLIMAGRDPVAVNTVVSKILDFDPTRIHQNRIASETGLGMIDLDRIEIRGEEIQEIRVKLEKPPENIFYFKKYLKRLLPYPIDMKVVDGNPCMGCLGQILFTLNVLKEEHDGLLKKIKNLTTLVGPGCELPQNAEKILVLGRCAHHLKSEGVFVDGCAPMSSDIIKALEQIYH